MACIACSTLLVSPARAWIVIVRSPSATREAISPT